MQSNREIILELKNIIVRYGPIVALKNVSLSIASGEIVALLGSNGCGKSTLLQSIVGIKKPDDGSILYRNREIKSWNPERIVSSGIYLIPEEGGIFRTLTVEENLQLGAYYTFSQYQSQFEMVIQLFPILKQRLKQIAGTLSGGEQRILAFGKGLMSFSQIFMLDEPSLGLSPGYITQIFETIKKLNEYGYTILLAEQNIMQALKVAQRIYILEEGQIALQGQADEIKSHHRIKETYFGG